MFWMSLDVIGLYKPRWKGGRAVGATAGPKAPAGPEGAVKPTEEAYLQNSLREK